MTPGCKSPGFKSPGVKTPGCKSPGPGCLKHGNCLPALNAMETYTF